MSAIGPKVYTTLTGAAPVTAVAGTRIYPIQRPQDSTLPAISFLRIGGARGYAMDGDTGLENISIQIDCWADSLSASDALMNLVITAMTAETTFSVYDITSIYETEEDGDFRVSRDFLLWNQEI